MSDYYAMEPIRDIVIRKGYKILSSASKPVPLPGWNKYIPGCPSFSICRKGFCVGFVRIEINTEWIYLEISFFKNQQRAFIRVDNIQMQKLIDYGIITEASALAIESF